MLLSLLHCIIVSDEPQTCVAPLVLAHPITMAAAVIANHRISGRHPLMIAEGTRWMAPIQAPVSADLMRSLLHSSDRRSRHHPERLTLRQHEMDHGVLDKFPVRTAGHIPAALAARDRGPRDRHIVNARQ